MAKIDSKSLSAGNFGSYFSSLNCPLLSVSGETVTIGGRLSFYDANGYQFYIKWDDSAYSNMNCNFGHDVLVYYSDNFFYCEGLDPQSRRWYVRYEKIGDTVLWAANCNNSTGLSRLGMTDVALTDAATGTAYVHGKTLNYAAATGTIDYADSTSLFNYNDIKQLNDPNFMACSTVTKGITITVGGKNYYTVHTNILMPLD